MHMIRIEIPPGWIIHRAVDTAALMAKAASVRIGFRFNGVEVEVDPDSDPNEVQAWWDAYYGGRARR